MRNLSVATLVGLVSFLVGGAPTAVGAVLVVAPIAVALLPARRSAGKPAAQVLPNAYPSAGAGP